MTRRIFAITWLLVLICFPLNSYAQEESHVQIITPQNVQNLALVGTQETQAPYYGAYRNLAWSPDGATWATASAVGIVLYDAIEPTHPPRLIASEGGSINAVAYSPDSTQIASSGSDGTVRLWNLASGELQQAFTGHVGEVACVTFSSDGTKLVSGGNDSTVRVWDIATGAQQLVLEGHEWGVTQVAISPDNTLIASASSDELVILWDAVTGEELNGHHMHFSRVTGLAFSPDGKMLASGSGDNTVVLWDVARQGIVQVLSGPLAGVPFDESFSVTDIAYNSQGDLALIRLDGSISVWHQPSSGKPVVTSLSESQRSRTSWYLAFSPDGKKLARSNSSATIEVWGIETDTLIQTIPGHNFDTRLMAYTSAGNRAAFVAGRQVEVWNFATGMLEQTWPRECESIRGLDFSPDGRWLAETETWNYGSGGLVRLWNIESGELLWATEIDRWAEDVTFSTDGSLLAASTSEGVLLFDPATGNRLRALEQPSVFTQDDQFWLTHPATGETLLIADDYFVWWESVFGQNGTLLATATDYLNEIIAVWNVEDGDLIQFFTITANDLAASSSGTTLAILTEANRVELWDMASGQSINQLAVCPASNVIDLAVSPDGALVATACEDETIAFWDVTTGENPVSLATQTRYSLYRTILQFSADGTLLLAFCSDGVLRQWGIPTQLQSNDLRPYRPGSREAGTRGHLSKIE